MHTTQVSSWNVDANLRQLAQNLPELSRKNTWNSRVEPDSLVASTGHLRIFSGLGECHFRAELFLQATGGASSTGTKVLLPSLCLTIATLERRHFCWVIPSRCEVRSDQLFFASCSSLSSSSSSSRFRGRSRGKRMTSRMERESVSNMVSRSMPTPSPAVGGNPYDRARM